MKGAKAPASTKVSKEPEKVWGVKGVEEVVKEGVLVLEGGM